MLPGSGPIPGPRPRRRGPQLRTSCTEEILMRDFCIQLAHGPGEVARVAGGLARKQVNLRSVCAMAFGGEGQLHLIADDIEATRSSLQEANIRFEESEVVTVLLENRAGELEDVADKLSKAGVN